MKKTHGFTIIELIVVISIVAILAAAPLIAVNSLNLNLGGQAKQIISDIRYTQSLAMTKGSRYRFRILSSTTYQVQDSSGTAVSLNGSTTTTLNSGITFGTSTNLPNNLINFDTKGAPYTDTASPGTALASTASIVIRNSLTTLTMSISPSTGYVQ